MTMERTIRRPDRERSMPEAHVVKSHISWLIWLIPVAAVGFCGWLLFRDFVSKGPTVHITFQEAEDMDPGNTPIKYRGAEVGKVTAVKLRPDHKAVL
jgi:paraquat-inducible protein B